MSIIYRLLFQRVFNTDLYNDNHLSPSFSERVQNWPIQWEPLIVFFFRESSILIYIMITMCLLLFQREFNTDLYNDNHLSPSFELSLKKKTINGSHNIDQYCTLSEKEDDKWFSLYRSVLNSLWKRRR